MIIKVEDGKVAQKWTSGKTLERLQEQFPDADLRESSAECGQIEVNGVFVDPPPTPEDPALAVERKRLGQLIKKVTTPSDMTSKVAIQKLFRHILAEQADESE